MTKAQKFLENHKRVVGIIGFIFIVWFFPKLVDLIAKLI